MGPQVDASGEGGIGRARDGPGGVRIPVLVGGERPTQPLVPLYGAFGECHRRQRAGAQGGGDFSKREGRGVDHGPCSSVEHLRSDRPP